MISVRFLVALAALAALAVTALDPAPTAPGPDRRGVAVAVARAAAPEPSPAAVGAPSAGRDTPPPVPRCDVRTGAAPPPTMPAPGAMPAGSAMARIVGRGRLVVAVDLATYLWTSRDPGTRRIEGFDADLARDIAQALFGDRERVEFLSVDVAGRLSAVQRGTADISLSALTLTCDRRDEIGTSVPYFETGQRVLVDRGTRARSLDDLAGRPVCAASGSTSLRNLLAAPRRPAAVAAPDDARCLVALQLGEVVAVSTDEAILAGLAAQDPQLEIVGPRFTEELYGVGMRKDEPDLRSFVDGVLRDRLADGRWQASYDRWLARLGPARPPAIRYEGVAP